MALTENWLNTWRTDLTKAVGFEKIQDHLQVIVVGDGYISISSEASGLLL